jgi:hypothetical protein
MVSTLRFLIGIFAAAALSACNSHAYYNEAMLYMEQTREVLIAEGLCFDKTDCSRKEMAFWSAGGWGIGPITGGGVTINVQKISDAAIAEKIVQRCKVLHSQIPSVPVTVTIFANAHIDNLHPGTPVVVKKARFD